MRQHLAVAAAALVAVAMLAAPAGADPVMVLHMDETSGTTVADSTANGNDGTIGAGGAAFVDGVYFGGLGFGGATGQYVTVPGNASNDIDHRSFAIEMWAYQDAGQTTFQCVAGKNDSDGPHVSPYTNATSKRLHLRVYADGHLRLGFWGNDLNTAAGAFTYRGLGASPLGRNQTRE